MVWIPDNAKMRQARLSDSPSDAASYLASTVPEPENAALREAFLSRGPEAIDYPERNTEVRLQPVKVYPDYYPEKRARLRAVGCSSLLPSMPPG